MTSPTNSQSYTTIGMTKEEYLGEKKLLDDQIQEANLDIERIERELRKMPTESDLENL
jgi:hypothetical protein